MEAQFTDIKVSHSSTVAKKYVCNRLLSYAIWIRCDSPKIGRRREVETKASI